MSRPAPSIRSNPATVWIRIHAVPVILITVAVIHFAQWAVWNRSSWGSGCGFGMFSSVDYHGSRFIRCYRESPTGRTEIPTGKELDSLRERVLVMPTHKNLQEFLRSASRSLTRKASDSFVVEVWGLEIHGGQQRIRSRLINRVTLDDPAGACGPGLVSMAVE